MSKRHKERDNKSQIKNMGTVCIYTLNTYTRHINTGTSFALCCVSLSFWFHIQCTFILSLPLCTFVLPLSPSNIVSLLQLHTKLDVSSLFIFASLPSSPHKHPHRHRTITKGRNRRTAHAYTHTHAQTWFSSLLLGFFVYSLDILSFLSSYSPQYTLLAQ